MYIGRVYTCTILANPTHLPFQKRVAFEFVACSLFRVCWWHTTHRHVSTFIALVLLITLFAARSESSKLHLLVVTADGRRVYFTTQYPRSAYYNTQYSQAGAPGQVCVCCSGGGGQVSLCAHRGMLCMCVCVPKGGNILCAPQCVLWPILSLVLISSLPSLVTITSLPMSGCASTLRLVCGCVCTIGYLFFYPCSYSTCPCSGRASTPGHVSSCVCSPSPAPCWPSPWTFDRRSCQVCVCVRVCVLAGV
jgi:hypothetical protein